MSKSDNYLSKPILCNQTALPSMYGCLKFGVSQVSKSQNSFKNLEIWTMILKIFSSDGWQCMEKPSTALLYSITGSKPFSQSFCQYLLSSYLLLQLNMSKKFSMFEMVYFNLKQLFAANKWYVSSSSFLMQFSVPSNERASDS